MLADTLVARALGAVGLSYGDPATRERYARLLYPGDRTADGQPNTTALQLASSQSSCLLFARALLAADEVDGVLPWPSPSSQPLDVLRCSYARADVLGRVEGLLRDLGRARGVELDAQARSEPSPGDLLVIGYGGSLPAAPTARAQHLRDWGGVAHGLIVTGVRREGGRVVVESVDGGQTDPRNGGRPTAIQARVRELQYLRDAWWLVGGSDMRRLSFGMRCGALPCRVMEP